MVKLNKLCNKYTWSQRKLHIHRHYEINIHGHIEIYIYIVKKRFQTLVSRLKNKISNKDLDYTN